VSAASENGKKFESEVVKMIKKGDRFRAPGGEVEVLRVGKTWVDIKVQQPGGASWTKRQPLPFPRRWEKIGPKPTEYYKFNPDWTIHPGVFWHEALVEDGRSQAAAAREMGISQKHISQIVSCHVTPGVDATVAFSRVMDLPVELMWNLACSYRLALALGKKDLTPEYL
jgi:plasmid maintenance system antidote protein VapI